MRTVVWFSCGAASACALKLLAEESPVAVYCDLSKDEHEDNKRFLKDVESWTGISITIIGSQKYKSIENVAEARKYMAGISGAPCTVEMKKVPRFDFQLPDDVHVFGMTFDERRRIKKFEANNHDISLKWPLVESRMTKADCFAMIAEAGIEIPIMYKQGFRNNNCIGCFKATSAKYWDMIRRFYPEVFERRCKQSEELGVKLVRYKGNRINLRELPLNPVGKLENISCGPECAQERKR